jgi:two-component system sensor histidine kinase YesM
VRAITFPKGWQIKVIDNGKGITEDKLEEIRKAREDVKNRLSHSRYPVEMEIGGMGLINIFARLYILYTEDLQFTITSPEEGGTEVSITIYER